MRDNEVVSEFEEDEAQGGNPGGSGGILEVM